LGQDLWGKKTLAVAAQVSREKQVAVAGVGGEGGIDTVGRKATRLTKWMGGIHSPEESGILAHGHSPAKEYRKRAILMVGRRGGDLNRKSQIRDEGRVTVFSGKETN